MGNGVLGSLQLEWVELQWVRFPHEELHWFVVKLWRLGLPQELELLKDPEAQRS